MLTMDDLEAIKRVKYRYLRALDTKHWADFADTLTEDIIGDYGSSLGEEHHFTNRKDLVDFMRKSMPAGVLTEHRVTHPEISVDGDEAEAIWYLQDRVIVPEFNFMLEGAAFYRDNGVERLFRDIQGARFHPMQQGPQATYAGKIALGQDIATVF